MYFVCLCRCTQLLTSVCRTRLSSCIAIDIILLLVASFVFAQPLKDGEPISNEWKSCGPILADRVNRVCEARGGHITHTNANSRSHTRARRGIVQECCQQKCADEDIVFYCVNSELDATSATPKTTSTDVHGQQSATTMRPTGSGCRTFTTLTRPTLAASAGAIEARTLRSSVRAQKGNNNQHLQQKVTIQFLQYPSTTNRYENVRKINSLTLTDLVMESRAGTVPPMWVFYPRKSRLVR